MSLVAARCNGAPASSVSIVDRGLQYGDGVFRTVRVRGGRPEGWAAHLARLAHDCERLALPGPASADLAADLAALFEDGGDGIAKLVVTRGGGGRGYTPPDPPKPTRLALRFPPPAYPEAYRRDGVAVGVSGIVLARQPALAGVKHLNRLEQVLARRECAGQGWPEALMTTDDGRVVCGTMSNLFAVIAGRLVTPAIRDAGVLGATRARLMAAFAADGIPVAETELGQADILGADELFLCNSAMPVWPIRAVQARTIPPGPMSARAQTLLEAR